MSAYRKWVMCIPVAGKGADVPRCHHVGRLHFTSCMLCKSSSIFHWSLLIGFVIDFSSTLVLDLLTQFQKVNHYHHILLRVVVIIDRQRVRVCRCLSVGTTTNQHQHRNAIPANHHWWLWIGTGIWLDGWMVGWRDMCPEKLVSLPFLIYIYLKKV